MLYDNDVHDTRRLFFLSWKKFLDKEVLEPLEQQIVEVIQDHPEYHAMFAASVESVYHYSNDVEQSNPFLHMGLHLAIRDQIHTNRPMGIRKIYQQLMQKKQDTLAVEHCMMDHLAECLWNAQRNQCPPNETDYLAALSRLSASLIL